MNRLERLVDATFASMQDLKYESLRATILTEDLTHRSSSLSKLKDVKNASRSYSSSNTELIFIDPTPRSE